MDRVTLSKIDEELESSEVAALRFLCRDVVNRKRLETVVDGKGLFLRLEERGLLENDAFLSQLLKTIGRNDLLSFFRSNNSEITETDSSPMLSDYRVMLYHLHEDLTQENLDKIKFLLENKLGRRQVELCYTALDVFSEMEKKSLLSNTKLNELSDVLNEVDRPLAESLNNYIERTFLQSNNNNQITIPPRVPPCLSVSETQPSSANMENCVYSDANSITKSVSSADEAEYYSFTHMPRGLCVIINNENFNSLKYRAGSAEDARALKETFTSLGFDVKNHSNLNRDEMMVLLDDIGKRDFHDEDALVVCVLSHGDNGCVFSSDAEKVSLRELTKPFTSPRAPSLAGKPKMFFIQACQGSDYQTGFRPSASKSEEVTKEPQIIEADAGPVQGDTVPSDADFLLGMSTVPECKSFRSTTTGSIYIQELCTQINKSAQSAEIDDMLSILTRVNRNVSKGEYLRYKQMPEPKYTLTKKIVLKCA
ncbi:unnamed protein product [Knipowitschia caucasica]